MATNIKSEFKDELSVEGLTLRCFLGTKKWEKMTRQEVVIDLKIWSDLSKAAKSDSLEHTVNIGKVVSEVTKYVGASTHRLIESLALELARIIVTEFNVSEVEVKVKKPGAFKNATYESVILRRSRQFFV